jgi:hypothetical protein
MEITMLASKPIGFLLPYESTYTAHRDRERRRTEMQHELRLRDLRVQRAPSIAPDDEADIAQAGPTAAGA